MNDPGRSVAHGIHGLETVRVVIRGGGEMGSGVAWRLRRCGFPVIVAETERPMAIRRWVAYSEAVYEGSLTVDGIGARQVEVSRIDSTLDAGLIPVVVCPAPEAIKPLDPDVLIDAILAKENTGTTLDLASFVVGLGPGFTVGEDVHCVIETNRGANLGRCLWQGAAEADTGVPGVIAGESVRRILRAPVSGDIEPVKEIGDRVQAGDLVATVAKAPVRAQIDGIVRGLLGAGTPVDANRKIGDIDPRGDAVICRKVSDKALAIAGGVLEAILTQYGGLAPSS